MNLNTRIPPQVPAHIDCWSTRGLAAWLGVSVSTVKYHARHAFRGHTGRWDLNREQAQKVVNRIFHFGHAKVVMNHLKTNPSNSAKAVAQSPDLKP